MFPAASSNLCAGAGTVILQERQKRKIGVHVRKNTQSITWNCDLNIHIRIGTMATADQPTLSITPLNVTDAIARRAMAARPPA